MAYSLRLPANIDALARERADALGISLNALLCVAVDAFLSGTGQAPASANRAAPGTVGPSKTKRSAAGPEATRPEPVAAITPSGPTRAERVEFTARMRAERKAFKRR